MAAETLYREGGRSVSAISEMLHIFRSTCTATCDIKAY